MPLAFFVKYSPKPEHFLQFVIHPEAMKNNGMWNDQINLEAISGIEVWPSTISTIVMPLAISIHWFLSCTINHALLQGPSSIKDSLPFLSASINLRRF